MVLTQPLAKRLMSFIAFLFALTLTSACSSSIRPVGSDAPWPTEGWPISSPEEQDMDSIKLNQMMALIEERDAAIDSVLVIRHGFIVFEKYRNDYDQESSHHVQSVTKSFTSTLVGIAIHEGFIKDDNKRMLDFFPERAIANLDLRKQNITVKNLLTMSDGMDWHEVDIPYTHPDNSLGQMWESDDVIQHVLDQPMVRDPGVAWNYNSGTSILLGNIVEQATDQDILLFARQYLFDPLGIGSLYWAKADRDHYHTDGGLYMRPRDMARLGYLMLRNGVWEGKQILPPEWVEEATTAHYETGGAYGYGYQWWTLPQNGIYAALGHYDQAIFVIPEADLVVVFTANIADEAIHPEDGLLLRHILGACNDLPHELTHKRFSKYGFTYEHGLEFSVLELPARDTDEFSNASGSVQFRYISYPIELFTVWWDETLFNLDSESILNQSILATAGQFQLELTPGRKNKLRIDDRELLAQSFIATTGDLQLAGIATVWICDPSERNYVLSYVTDAASSDADLSARFEELLEPFTCLE